MTVAVHAMAKLAVRLVVIEPVAEGEVLRASDIGAGPQGRYGKASHPPHALQRADHERYNHTCRSTIIFLTSAMALAGLRLFGQALAQFMMVWQR